MSKIINDLVKNLNGFEATVNTALKLNENYLKGDEATKTKIKQMAENILIKNLTEKQILNFGTSEEIGIYFPLISTIETQVPKEYVSKDDLLKCLKNYFKENKIIGRDKQIEFAKTFTEALEKYTSIFQQALGNPKITVKLSNIKV